MRRLIVALLMAALLVVGFANAALAHVHGITPLNELGCKVDNTVTGGFRADDNAAANLSGLIPSNLGSSSLTSGDGGFGAANDDVC